MLHCGSFMGNNLTYRYTKIKYSDLVSQDENTRDNMTKALFEFIGIPFSKEVADNVKDFRSDNGGTGYYSVNRPADYNPDHWKDEIQQKVKEILECMVLNALKTDNKVAICPRRYLDWRLGGFYYTSPHERY